MAGCSLSAWIPPSFLCLHTISRIPPSLVRQEAAWSSTLVPSWCLSRGDAEGGVRGSGADAQVAGSGSFLFRCPTLVDFEPLRKKVVPAARQLGGSDVLRHGGMFWEGARASCEETRSHLAMNQGETCIPAANHLFSVPGGS